MLRASSTRAGGDIHLFAGVPWHLHRLDQSGICSLDAMMAIYGLPEAIERPFQDVIQEQFHFTPRPDALCFEDGDVFDLGGTRLQVIHSPGHTRGHCCFLIEWQGGARRLLDYLSEPHSLEEIVEHRFVYRPKDRIPWVDAAEQRSMAQHVQRLLTRGRIKETEQGRYRAQS